MVSKEVAIDTLDYCDKDIWRGMGMGNDNIPDQEVLNIISDMKLELKRVAKPIYSYVLTNTVDFKCGAIITKAFKDGDRFAVILLTLGSGVDDLLKGYKESDIVNAFIADAIASELTEALCRKVVADIELLLEDDEQISSSYSPGYCGWLLKEQVKLFSYFKDQSIGISLTPSCLMIPMKSISTVVAIGRNVEKQPYGCEICAKLDCYKKRK